MGDHFENFTGKFHDVRGRGRIMNGYSLVPRSAWSISGGPGILLGAFPFP